MTERDTRILAWFSCGVPSAIAAKLAIEKHGVMCSVVYAATNSEHPDNKRFFKAVQSWLGVKIEIIRSKKYKNVDDVFDSVRFLRRPEGARCTTEMKKIPRYDFQQWDDTHVFGYTFDKADVRRTLRFKDSNPELNLVYPLLEKGLTRQDCMKMIREAGIEIPKMYRLGFNNNNCLGCVKSESPTYWLRIKEEFPEVFDRRARQERELGFALCRVKKKPVFLDELTPDMSTGKMDPINCDFLCGEEE